MFIAYLICCCINRDLFIYLGHQVDSDFVMEDWEYMGEWTTIHFIVHAVIVADEYAWSSSTYCESHSYK